MKGVRRLGKWVIECAAMAAEAGLQAVGVPSPSALLILAHMRSGSTLLLHLLLTNPEVAALGERGAVYASRADLACLAVAARTAHRSPLRRLRYVADQVNHNQLTPNSRLLQDPRVRILFLLRRPEPAIASILELYRTHYRKPWPPAQAVDYYVGRLAALMKLGAGLASPMSAALIPYEILTGSPRETLEALRLFLGLQSGFTQTYATHRFTGKHGDPGPNIVAGRIIHTMPATQIHLDASELERATRVYDQCRSTLARFALHV